MGALLPVGDFPAVLAFLAGADPDRRLAPCGLRRVVLGQDVVDRVGDELAGLLGPSTDSSRPTVTLLTDDTTILRLGVDLKATVARQLSSRAVVRLAVLNDPRPPLHADERAVAAAIDAARGSDAVVTVGGGTITDLGKIAAKTVAVRHVVVQTAASVDGFTDDVSVLLRSGVKRTVASRWPDVVISDVATIAEAPAGMNRAGFGELTSMFTAPADWRLASLLGVDPTYREAPVRLLDTVGADVASWSAGVAGAEPAAVERLTWALAVRGVVTGVAGSTAVLSGVEHLVSHMLDLDAAATGRPAGLHGAQVGAAAVAAAAAWELLFERLADRGATLRLPDVDTARRRVEAAFGHLGDRAVEECWRDYSAKLARWSDWRSRIEQVIADWSAYEPELRRRVWPAAQIKAALAGAGSAARLADLQPGVPAELARWALRHCALMRDRTTVVDLLDHLGWWTDDDVDELLERVEAPEAATAVAAGGTR